jgi:hypothetical protein
MSKQSPSNRENSRANEKKNDNASHSEPIQALDNVNTPADSRWSVWMLAVGFTDKPLFQFLGKTVEPELERMCAGVEEGVKEDVYCKRRIEINGTWHIVVPLHLDFFWGRETHFKNADTSFVSCWDQLELGSNVN